MKKLLIFFTLESLKLVSLAIDFSCDPLTDCSDPNVHGSVPDPTDCNKYYECIKISEGVFIPSETPIPCPDGSYFDQAVAGCSQSSEPCENACCNNCDPSEISCDTDGVTGSFPFPCQCSWYYKCDAGHNEAPLPQSCAAGTYFNAELGACIPGNCPAEQLYCSSCSNCDYLAVATTPTPDTTTSSPCLPSYNCTENGNFPSCPFCDPSYWHCADGQATLENCPEDTVFNTNADRPYCVPPENCPFPPSVTDATTPPSEDTTFTIISGCQVSYDCPLGDGNFQNCPYCHQSYWHCEDGIAFLQFCCENTVFNTDDKFPYCLNPLCCPFPNSDECPFPYSDECSYP